MPELRANEEPSGFLRVTAGKLATMAKRVSWRTVGSVTTVTERQLGRLHSLLQSGLSNEGFYDSDSLSSLMFDYS